MATVQDGPLATPTSATDSSTATISTNPLCGPTDVAPGDDPQPLLASTTTADCGGSPAPATPGPLIGQGRPPLRVTGGAAALSINCTLPGSCNGTASLLQGASGATASAARLAAEAANRHKPHALVLGSVRVHLRHGRRGLVRIRLTAKARRVVQRHRSGVLATLRLTVRGKIHTLATVRLVEGRR